MFTVLIWGENRSKFGTPESEYKGKRVCVTGKIREVLFCDRSLDLDGPTLLETLVFLRGTLHGRPAQKFTWLAACSIRTRFRRPLETLTDEELCLLDSVTKKLSAPATSDASPDGQQNQIDSKPAIEADVVASEAASQ